MSAVSLKKVSGSRQTKVVREVRQLRLSTDRAARGAAGCACNCARNCGSCYHGCASLKR